MLACPVLRQARPEVHGATEVSKQPLLNTAAFIVRFARNKTKVRGQKVCSPETVDHLTSPKCAETGGKLLIARSRSSTISLRLLVSFVRRPHLELRGWLLRRQNERWYAIRHYVSHVDFWNAIRIILTVRLNDLSHLR